MNKTLAYYGGRRGYGSGSIQEKDVSDNSDDGYYWNRSNICDNMNPYGTGDCIRFNVDFDEKKVEFYLNGTLKYASKSDVFPVGDC